MHTTRQSQSQIAWKSFVILIAFNNNDPALEEPVGFQDQSTYAIIPSTSYPSLLSAFSLSASEATTGPWPNSAKVLSLYSSLSAAMSDHYHTLGMSTALEKQKQRNRCSKYIVSWLPSSGHCLIFSSRSWAQSWACSPLIDIGVGFGIALSKHESVWTSSSSHSGSRYHHQAIPASFEFLWIPDFVNSSTV